MCYQQIIQLLNMTFNSPVIKGVGALLGLYIVYRLGLRAYYLQREYEDVRMRYLDKGLDMATAQVEYALSVYRSNWHLFLRYIKLCREMTSPFDASDFFHQFREIDYGEFQVTPVHRINALFPNSIIWNQYQRVFSFVGISNDRIKADFGEALKVIAKNPKHENHTTIVDTADALANELNDRCSEFYIYLSELNNLAQVFEHQRIRRKDLQSFQSRKDVAQIAARLAIAFPETEDG